MEEYEYIRREIELKINKIDNFNSVFYATVAVIFTFAFTQKEALVFLVPVIVIVPIYTIRMDEISSMLRMGAYLFVFWEGTDFFWETRLIKYDEKFKYNKPDVNPYVIVSVVSFLLCISKLDYSNIKSKGLWIRIFFAVAFLVFCLIIIYKK